MFRKAVDNFPLSKSKEMWISPKYFKFVKRTEIKIRSSRYLFRLLQSFSFEDIFVDLVNVSLNPLLAVLLKEFHNLY